MALTEPDKIPGIVSGDFVGHDLPRPGGLNVLVAFRRMVMKAFPDQRTEILQLMAEGDVVAARWRLEQTHTGPFLDLAPTGKRVILEGFEFVQIKDGKVAIRWLALKPTINEVMGWLRQGAKSDAKR